MVLAGCASDPVPVDAPELTGADARACDALLADLPATLADEDARETDPADARGAAYGDPPIVVTCTDEPPTQFSKFSDCTEANDVGWFVPDEQLADDDADAVMWAVSYRPVVVVHLPGDYRPEGGAAVLAELADPVREHLTRSPDC